jgi:hypothetical protein
VLVPVLPGWVFVICRVAVGFELLAEVRRRKHYCGIVEAFLFQLLCAKF